LAHGLRQNRHVGSVGEASPVVYTRGLPSLPVAGVVVPLAGVALLTAMLLSAAVWNGFPFIFYDTGGYLTEGLGGVFLAERAPVYSLLLFVAGSKFSLWPIVILQAAMTAFIVTETARAEVPGLTLWGLAGIGIALILLTGISWYAGQVEPDCMTALLVLGCYLLMFRSAGLSRTRRWAVFAVTTLAVACHPSHLGLMGGLLICGLLLKLGCLYMPALPRPRLAQACISLLGAILLILAANYGLARGIFISRSGSVFVFARLMQDGIVKRLLHDTCPQSGYKLCAWRGHLKTRVDAWLWSPDSGFRALGGFTSREQRAEDTRIILDSLERYPVMNLRAAAYDSALQFLLFRTGDGIEPQMSVIETSLQHLIPRQIHAYLAARQQRGLLRFRSLNLLHVPIGVLGVLGLLLLIQHAGAGRRWGHAQLPALVLLALIGNAIICGTFAEPHDRYQSRVIWLPVLVLILTRMRDPHALQPAETA
jgi:hypothetical protein